MMKNIKLKTLFVGVSLVSICLVLSSCSNNDIVTQGSKNEQNLAASSSSGKLHEEAVSRTSNKKHEDTALSTEVISNVISNGETDKIKANSKKVIENWEEFEASDMPLIAAIPEKDIYLYAIKSAKDAQVALHVGESVHYYNWYYMTPRFILPQMQVSDYDKDGKDELSVILYVGSGTGVSVQELHIVEIPEGKKQSSKQLDNANPEYYKDYIFDDYCSQLKKAISFKTFIKAGKLMGKITAGTKTYTVNLEEFQSEDCGKVNDNIGFGDIVRFDSQKNKLVAEFGFGITCEKFAAPRYIGAIHADVDYKAGKFKLKNFRFEEDKN